MSTILQFCRVFRRFEGGAADASIRKKRGLVPHFQSVLQPKQQAQSRKESGLFLTSRHLIVIFVTICQNHLPMICRFWRICPPGDS